MRLRRLLFVILVAAVAALASSSTLSAQGSDVIRGRITGVDSLPLEGARITVTSVVTLIERPTRTDKNGRFTVIFPGADGHYMVTVSTVGYLVKSFELKRTAEQDILVADANLEKVQLEPVIVTADVRGTIPRGGINPDISGTQQAISGIALDQQGNLAAMAATLPGVLLIPGLNGAADGFSVLGLDPSDNTITMNGMTFNGGDLPRDAGISSSLNTSPYDVSRGGFSGGELALRSSSGSNIMKQGMSLTMNLPQLHWTDLASRATGTGSTTALSLGGVAAGPIVRNSSYYNLSAQFDRSSNPLRTLLNTSAFGMQANGVSQDSVFRMLDVLDQIGVPATIGGSINDVVNDKASFFGSFNLNPLTSPTAAQYGLTVNANWSNNEPTNLGSGNVLPSFGGKSTTSGAGLSLRHTAYLKIFLTETSVSLSGSQNKASPFVFLPSGSVRVNSMFEDGSSPVIRNLSFGGNQNANSSSTRSSAGVSNSLSWFSTNNKHRLRLTSELNYSGTNSDQANNYLGSFAFNSLADLEAGIPSSYRRQLSVRRDESSQMTGSLALGNSYRHSPDLQFQYGVRVEGGTYFDKPEYNPALETLFGVRNDFIPNQVYVSPRIGFSWTLGTAQQLSAFEGQVRGPRAILRGGISLLRNGVGSISQVVNNTGLPNSIQSLNCVGPATPVPDWDLYVTNPEMIPDECADGSQGTVFSNSSPSATLYSRNFRVPGTLRTELNWSGSILDNRFGLSLRGSHSLNMNRGSEVDLNFDATPNFSLASEGGRPVFVETTSIVPTTGSIASRDARVVQEFSSVRELRSDLTSQTVQLQMSLSPRYTNPFQNFRIGSISYIFQDVREQLRGFTSTVGNPQDIYWSRGANTARHQFGYSLSYELFKVARLTWNGKVMSGRPYTPTISGDVNGDGRSNDRPFIFDPATTADPALAAAMNDLLTTASDDARKCLRKQLGQLAKRNSCETGWVVTGDLQFTLDQAKLRLPNRTQLEITFENPMGGLDMLVNGSRSPKGWGQNALDQVDPTLLYVRGFDANTNSFKYEVNQRFGAQRQNTSISPRRITTGVRAMLRMDIGPTRERQTLSQSLAYGRTDLTSSKYPMTIYKSQGVSGIPNPITIIMRQQDSLRLTTAQADSLATLNRKYTIQLDSIWSVAAQYFNDLPNEFKGGDAWQRYLLARRAAVDMLVVIGPQVKGMLTPAQLRKLPPQVHNTMDPRYLNAVRNGNGTYVSSTSGLGISSPVGAEVIMSGGAAGTIIRSAGGGL